MATFKTFEAPFGTVVDNGKIAVKFKYNTYDDDAGNRIARHQATTKAEETLLKNGLRTVECDPIVKGEAGESSAPKAKPISKMNKDELCAALTKLGLKSGEDFDPSSKVDVLKLKLGEVRTELENAGDGEGKKDEGKTPAAPKGDEGKAPAGGAKETK